MENKNKQYELEEKQLALIKSHLFEGLEVLKNLQLKREFRLFDNCNECGKRCRTKNLKIYKNKRLCYQCHSQKVILIKGRPTNQTLTALEDAKNLPRILNSTKQPIIANPEPIIQDSTVVHSLDILKGLTDFQKTFIKGLVEKGLHPLGFTVYTDSNEIYYMGEKIY